MRFANAEETFLQNAGVSFNAGELVIARDPNRIHVDGAIITKHGDVLVARDKGDNARCRPRSISREAMGRLLSKLPKQDDPFYAIAVSLLGDILRRYSN